jgi:DNA-binding beta-propeller fold protein YncE
MMNRARLAVSASLLLVLISGCSRFSSSAQAQNPSPPALEFVSQWGTKGEDPGQLDDPQGIAVDSIGNVYIADAGNGFITKFAANGTPLLSFQENSLKEPQSIAVDSGGAIYVTDPARSTVYVVFSTSEHDYHRVLRLRTRPSSENSLTVAVDDDGMIYVLDENAGKIFTFSPRLRLLRSWVPSPGRSAGGGRAASIGPLGMGADGNLYVADLEAGRLLRFDPSGHLRAEIPSSAAQSAPAADPPGQAAVKPRISTEFAVSRNYMFVMDENGSTLHVWNMDGSPKLDVDLSAKLGQVHRPPMLAVSQRHDLFVLDATNCRVLRYRINF